MRTDIDRDQALPIDQHLQRDPAAEVDRHRMQTLQASPQGMEPQRRMVRIGLQQQQRVAVALAQLRMAAQVIVHRAGVDVPGRQIDAGFLQGLLARLGPRAPRLSTVLRSTMNQTSGRGDGCR